jgi:microcystin degradation protein MlrC
MKIFLASIATETNTFAPAPTGMEAFGGEAVFLPPEAIDPATAAKMDTNPYAEVVNELAAVEGHEVVVGLSVGAQPSGATVRSAYERMRDHMLDQLRAAMPVQAVLLPLHGAMVAEGYFDCEGDIIEHVRAIVGPDVPIGVELDLHCHFTELMREQADIIIAYKEYPHTDVIDRLRELWRLTLDCAEGKIKPVTAVHDLRMVNFWHTTREPMMTFVKRMMALEGQDGILSVSFGHGFPYGDTPDNGAKIWVVSDSAADPGGARAAALAKTLGEEVWAMRHQTGSTTSTVDAAIDRVAANTSDKPVLMADTADNSGGGAASDSTFILQRLVERKVGNVALAPFWDLGAIQICREAGEGAVLDLRVGGKCGPASGQPVDLRVTVRAIKEDHFQSALGFVMGCGPSVWVSTQDGIDIVMISVRQQCYATDMFTNLGIDLTAKRGIVVKSSQHFYAQFAPLACEVVYVDTPGLIRNDFENLPFVHRNLNFWPRVENPWGDAA